jgi:hypothetical protein
MTSPDLINELKAGRPAAPQALRARVREISAQSPAPTRRALWPKLGPVFRIAVPAVVTLAVVSAGVLGVARSGGIDDTFSKTGTSVDTPTILPDQPGMAAPTQELAPARDQSSGAGTTGTTPIAPDTTRAQRVSATLTVEVPTSDGVSRAAQDALTLTRRLGGHVVSASVSTGDEGSAALTLRVPVAKVQDAIVQLSALGRIVSQQVAIDDLQASLDTLERRERSVRAQIALVTARLESETLDAPTRARLESRLQTLRSELRQLRRDTAATNAEARMATIQVSVVTPGVLGAVPVPSRLDRALDEALNILVWEGVVALAIAIVATPFALVIAATWLGRKLYRRREDERLLAT